MQQLDDILAKYSPERGNLLDILHDVHYEFGYLSRGSMEAVARYLRLSDGEVYSVASSYPGFKFTPSGRRCLKVCRGTACHVKGGKKILGELEKQLGIKPGETTADMEYSLDTVSCTGSCSLSPVIMVGDDLHGEMTVARIAEILEGADE